MILHCYGLLHHILIKLTKFWSINLERIIEQNHQMNIMKNNIKDLLYSDRLNKIQINNIIN